MFIISNKHDFRLDTIILVISIVVSNPHVGVFCLRQDTACQDNSDALSDICSLPTALTYYFLITLKTELAKTDNRFTTIKTAHCL